jgi:hypothetical protein
MKGKSNNGQPGPKGGTLAAQGINAAMRYIENEHGEVVDGYRATAIRENAHKIWFLLLENNLAPRTWGVATLEVCKHYNAEMVLHAPELRYCDSNWKAQHIATQNYSSWYSTHGTRKEAKVKNEATDSIPPVMSKAKHARTASASMDALPKNSKKARAGEHAASAMEPVGGDRHIRGVDISFITTKPVARVSVRVQYMSVAKR